LGISYNIELSTSLYFPARYAFPRIFQVIYMISRLKGLIFDIDGTLAFQNRLYPGVAEAIGKFREKGFTLRFLTNSTIHSRRSRAIGLTKLGLRIFPEEVVTASYATACYLRQQHHYSCWIILEGEGLEEFSGFAQNTTNPEYIVIGDNHSRFDYDHMNQVLRLLLGGAELIGMNPDLVDASSGSPELNVGSWVRMLEVASGLKATYIGKPFPYVFKLTLESMGLDKEQVLMVGDQLQADIKGAKGIGIRSVLVKTGESRLGDLKDIQPDFILDSVADLDKLVMK
jgi:HAD superfamily hydrolase (TIGR01458 family)